MESELVFRGQTFGISDICREASKVKHRDISVAAFSRGRWLRVRQEARQAVPPQAIGTGLLSDAVRGMKAGRAT